jgi:Zn-dependent peptidase ImmA (M78 family)
MNRTDWNILIFNLVEYCNSMGVKVFFKRGCSDEYEPDDKTIQINTQRTKENQLYILLHEIGHHLIFENSELADKFAILNEKKVKCNLSNQILELEEEVNAWHNGEEVARALGIELNSRFQLLKAKCLKSYIRSLTKI